MAEEYNNDHPLTMKRLAVRIDELEEAVSTKGEEIFPSESKRILAELERIAIAEEEANVRRKTMSATHVIRTVIDILLVIAVLSFLVGCTGEFPGLIIKPEGGIVLPEVEIKPNPGEGENVKPEVNVPSTLQGTAWTTSETMVEGMNVVGIEFNADGTEGNVIFVSRGAERSKPFTVEGNNLLFRAPEKTWTFETDFKTYLDVVSSDFTELSFIPDLVVEVN